MTLLPHYSIPWKFARIFQTPNLGQVVLVDDPASVTSDKMWPGARIFGSGPFAPSQGQPEAAICGLGHYEIYLAEDSSICTHSIQRNLAGLRVVKELLDLPEHQQGRAMQEMIERMHGASGQGHREYIEKMKSPSAKHIPFAKVIQSPAYGDILVMRDGDMSKQLPHIQLRWRPMAPCLASPSTNVSNLKDPSEIRGFDGYPMEVLKASRSRLLDTFCEIDRKKAEEIISGHIKHYQKTGGAVYHHHIPETLKS